ncbi:MAG TPA: family 20 glycosylhydrolase [Paludibacter sp.]|nr:family 20 glycosylhydrolase [Paludibacter sp.]
MRKKIVHLLLLVFILFFSSCSTREEPLRLVWKIEPANEQGYLETFYVISNTNKPVENNWTIYFSQLPHYFEVSYQEGISIEQISGSYYKINQTKKDDLIEKQDSLKIVLSVPYGPNSCSFYPESPFIVYHDKNGLDSVVADLPLIIDDSRNQICPSNSSIYDFNDKLNPNIALNSSDLIPSLKKVDIKQGVCKTKNSFNVLPDSRFINEADLLKQSLIDIKHKVSSTGSGHTTIKLLYETDETYVNEEHYFLTVSDSLITIKGQTAHAIFNGIQSLLTMLEHSPDLPYMSISDYPDLLHRGLMIDLARNFVSKEDLLNLINTISSYKLNVLHLHLADDEGWRLEIPGLEELTEIASKRGYTTDESTCLYPAYGSGWDVNNTQNAGNGFYTRNDFIEILQYAKQRHVKVIPEIDMPGHSRAAIKAMNARYNKFIDTDRVKAEEYLLTDFEDRSVYKSAQDYNDNVLNAALPSTYRFMEKVIHEVISIYQDADAPLDVFHIGGDEVPRGAWTDSPIAQDFMQKNGMKSTKELSDYFYKKLNTFLSEKGLIMAGWQEIALTPDHKVNPLFKNKKLQVNCWYTTPEMEDNLVLELAHAGHNIILSNVTNLYLDLSYNDSYNEPGHRWGGTVNQFTSFDFLPYEGLDKNQAAIKENIKGIQGQLWAETIRNFEMTEYLLFPKILGLVERAWNASPSWETDDNLYCGAVSKFNKIINTKYLPYLISKQVHVRIDQPGIKMIDGKIYMNSNIEQSEIRYTTDGSTPDQNSLLWTKPVSTDNLKQIKAKVFYLDRSSRTSVFEIK